MQTKSLFFGMLFYTLFRMIVVTLNIVNVILCMSEPSLLMHPLNCLIHLRVLLDNFYTKAHFTDTCRLHHVTETSVFEVNWLFLRIASSLRNGDLAA